jgi:hypothetical protein
MTQCPSCGWEWNAVRPALSASEATVLGALHEWEMSGHKTGPTFRELALATKTSTTRVHAVVQGLLNKGYVVFVPNRGRSLKSVGEEHRD